MMGLMAQRVFEAEERDRAQSSERQVLSTGANPAKVEKRQITRNRTSYSCQNCRKRKIKCDKSHPRCGACAKAQDECVYGKLEWGAGDKTVSNGHSASQSKRASSSPSRERHVNPFVDESASGARHANLIALEIQLSRLTSMVESLRKDGTAVAFHGVITPTSSRSPTDDGSFGRSECSAPSDQDHRSNANALSRPMSELDITKQKVDYLRQAQDLFMETLSGELDQLQSLLRGPGLFGGPAALAGEAGTGDGKPASMQPIREDGNRAPIGYHQAMLGHGPINPASNCQACLQSSCDKSIFLLGSHFQQARATATVDPTAGIPSESQSNALFRSWVTGVYPLLPFMPVRQAFRKHQSFWEWKRQYDQNPAAMTESADISFMPMLNTIWYAGALAMSAKGIQTWFPEMSRAQLAAHHHDQIIRYMTSLAFPTNIKLPFIGTLIVLESMPCAEQDPLQSSSYLNFVVRLSQSLGLHREAAQIGSTPYEIEICRRMWSHVVRLDTALSISNGMQSTIDDNLADAQSISEVKEYLIGTAEEKEYHDGSSSIQKPGVVDDPWGTSTSIISVFHLVDKANSLVDVALRKVVRTHTSPRQITREVLSELNKVISDTERIIKDIINVIPIKGVPELGFEPENPIKAPTYDCDRMLGSSLEEAELASYLGVQPNQMASGLNKYYRQKLCAFHKFARIMLSLLCDKMHCIAYAPFLKNARSKLWVVARQCALRHATSFLRKFVSLATDPSLEPFRWSWPGLHQPMHAAIIILVDVYERPHSVEAPRNRAWIDKVFALADPEVGIVAGLNGPSTQRPFRDGGADMWDMLRGLRNSAWRKAGLDPEVLWSEEDQILVGVAKPLTEEQRIAQTIREDSLYTDDPKNPDAESRREDIWRGMQHIMNIANQEARSAERSQVLKYALEGRAEQVLTATKPTAQRPVRLEGQQRMPFPMSGELVPRCAHAAVEASSPDVHHAADKADTILIQDLITRIKSFVDGKTHTSPSAGYFDSSNNGSTPQSSDDLGSQEQVRGTYNMITPSRGGGTRPLNDPGKSSFNGIVANGVQVDYSSVAEVQPAMPQFNENHGVTDAVVVGDSPGSFDWERWDAVFGKYGGFSDLMEDIQFESDAPEPS